MTRSDAVYVRKSTSPQEEQSQIDALEDYLKRQSITVPKEFWFTDTGSRHRPKDRPDFQRMLKLVEEKKIRRVFVWKQDRIVSGRNYGDTPHTASRRLAPSSLTF